ncbi:MerR family transcriptional regulator, partial [Nocardiopsis sp. MG754419]|uniref:MerR family transcriptional regulator n=1 Tax=Nocardiopsis sp. MG754419 TaxID=2259865 RepID=UPI001BAA1532
MSLFIKDFSEISELSPQTLRFYHSEGLLVPATVDEETGYRGYEVGQVRTALLITALRGAGLSVKEVRAALEAPDTAAGLLGEHVEGLRRRRAVQDEAIATAGELLTCWPRVEQRRVPQMTVLSRCAPAVAVERRRGQPDRYDRGRVAEVAA